MEGIFTINQPKTFLPDIGEYEPGHDVIDWPINKRPLPILKINGIDAGENYYKDLVVRLSSALTEPPRHSTPSILMTEDSDGRPVRLAIRERV